MTTTHEASARREDLSSQLRREAGEAKLRAVHDRLTRAITELTTAENWQLMLRTAAKLPTYSPHNVLLITTQCPHASAVAGFHTWKQLGRSVRKGEKGLAILAPVLRRTPNAQTMSGAVSELGAERAAPDRDEAGSEAGSRARRIAGFRVVHVFDISQTDGPDLPEPPRPVLLEGQAPPGLLDGLTAQVLDEGFQLLRHDFDLPHSGVGVPNGVTDYLARTVIVRPDLSDAQTVKTLAHELGHVLLHEPGRRPADLTRQQAEVEAESVAYVVADAHGLDTRSYTIPYVAGWSEGNLELLARSAERVIATSHQILRHTPPPPTTVLHSEGRAPARDHAPDRSSRDLTDPDTISRLAAPTESTLTDPTADDQVLVVQERTVTPSVPPSAERQDAPRRADRPRAETDRAGTDRAIRRERPTVRRTEQGRLW